MHSRCNWGSWLLGASVGHRLGQPVACSCTRHFGNKPSCRLPDLQLQTGTIWRFFAASHMLVGMGYPSVASNASQAAFMRMNICERQPHAAGRTSGSLSQSTWSQRLACWHAGAVGCWGRWLAVLGDDLPSGCCQVSHHDRQHRACRAEIHWHDLDSPGVHKTVTQPPPHSVPSPASAESAYCTCA